MATAVAIALGLTTVMVGGTSAAYADDDPSAAVVPQSVIATDEQRAEPGTEVASVAPADEPATPAPVAPPVEAGQQADAPVEQASGGERAIETAQPAAQRAAALTARSPQAAEVTLTNVAFNGTGKPLVVGQTIRFSADWSVPLDTEPGDYFTLTLPDQFKPASTNAFHLTENGTSTTLADCSWTGMTATCTFTDRVADIQSGNIWFTLSAQQETAEDANEVAFLLGSAEFTVSLPGGVTPKPDPGDGGGTTPSPGTVAPVKPAKSGYANSDSGRFSWTITIPAGQSSLSLVDAIDTSAGFEQHHFIGTPVLYSNLVKEDGYLSNWVKDTSFTASSVTISEDGRTLTIENFPLNPAAAYRLSYTTEADGMLFTGDLVGNSVTVLGSDITAKAKFTALAGGGGDPSQLGRFAIAKKVSGENAAAVPADTIFHVKATWNSGSETLTLRNDGTAVQSTRVPADTTITLSEVDLPTVDGVVWGTPAITGGDAVNNGDGTFSVTPQAGDVLSLVLTNIATPRPLAPGSFAIDKLLSGDATSKVPAGTEFTISYRIDEGEASEATVTVGRPLTVNDVPAGSQVTITEVNLPTITDVVWGTPLFSIDGATTSEAATFTVGEAQDVQISLTNTAKPVSPEVLGVEDTDDDDDSPDTLAFTGSQGIVWALVAGLTLVLSGAALVMTRRHTAS
ncbi:MAG: DUF5979 domain-containing protein [Propionicimonas sp.]|nr:DUF5979 domain-containing protein [Propionicimonas sp.]